MRVPEVTLGEAGGQLRSLCTDRVVALDEVRTEQ
jgi:hypothetical protein